VVIPSGSGADAGVIAKAPYTASLPAEKKGPLTLTWRVYDRSATSPRSGGR